MKLFNVETHKNAVSNFTAFLLRIALRIEQANTVSNKTFDSRPANLFGLTTSDISEALDSIPMKDEKKKGYLKKLVYYANGYRFTPDPLEAPEPVLNPETALQYLNVSYASRQ